MRIGHLSITGILLGGLIAIALPVKDLMAKEIAIYRWVDANNVVHFSQNLPNTDTYSELSTVSSFNALSKEARQAKEANENIEHKKITDSTTNKKTFEKNCQSAQFNIKMLSSYDEVLITEEKSDGTKIERALSNEEKKEKLTLSKKHVELYCEK